MRAGSTPMKRKWGDDQHGLERELQGGFGVSPSFSAEITISSSRAELVVRRRSPVSSICEGAQDVVDLLLPLRAPDRRRAGVVRSTLFSARSSHGGLISSECRAA